VQVRSLLASSTIRAAVRDFGRSPGTLRRLRWWLHAPHSAERWFQVEFGFALQQHVTPDYVVGCEDEHKDLVFYPALPKNPVAAVIELKWFGSWWLGDKIRKQLRADVDKIGSYRTPALALAVWLFAKRARPQDPMYPWLDKQRLESVPDLDRHLREAQLEPDIQFRVDCPPQPGFSTFSLVAVGFYNGAAQSLRRRH